MKIGIRTPSIKKSIKARTTGKINRTVKKSINPLYGKKGMGFINDPKKSVYNKVYNKTTIDVRPSSLVNNAPNKSKNKVVPKVEQNISENFNNDIKLSLEEVNQKITNLKISKKKSTVRCPIMFLLFFIFFMLSLVSGNFFLWMIAIITCVWAIGSGTNISVCKKDIKLLEEYIK